MTMKPLILIRTKSSRHPVYKQAAAASFKDLDPCVKIQSLKQENTQPLEILMILPEDSGNTTLPDNCEQLFRPSYTGPKFRCPTPL